MDQQSRHDLIRGAREEYALAKRITNEYIQALNELIEAETDPHERAHLALERLQLKVNLRILKGTIEEKLSVIFGGEFNSLE